MIKITSKKLVSGLIVALAISSISLNAADYYGTVNGEKITKQDIAIVLRNPNVNFNSLPKKSKNQVLDQVIEKKLLTEKAVKSGVDADVAYKDALVKLKRDLALEVWMQKEYKKVIISDKDKKAYYNKNKAKFKIPAMLEARHILTKTEKEAKDIIKSLNKASKKKDEFIKLAKTKSVGPTAPKGGYLGKFPETKMVPEFSKAAKLLSKGQYSKTPVKTQFGYHVIFLEDKVATQTVSFDKAKGRITQTLLQQKFRAHIKKQADALRKNAKIVIK
jgi:parvulin-like peptidyl-prolyl isomerase